MEDKAKNIRLPKMGEILILLTIFMVIMFSSVSLFDIEIAMAIFIVWFIVIGFGIYIGHSYEALQKSIIIMIIAIAGHFAYLSSHSFSYFFFK